MGILRTLSDVNAVQGWKPQAVAGGRTRLAPWPTAIGYNQFPGVLEGWLTFFFELGKMSDLF